MKIKITNKRLSAAMEALATWWCRRQHKAIYRPVRGFYRCQVCNRAYSVDWPVGSAFKSTENPGKAVAGCISGVELIPEQGDCES